MAQLICSQCKQPVQHGWNVCPYCGLSLAEPASTQPGRWSSARPTQALPAVEPPVVRLACPSCGGMLPLPTATTEYLSCPYCRSSLQLRRGAQGFTLEMARHMGQAVGSEVGREVGRQLRDEMRQQTEQKRERAQQSVRKSRGRAAAREASGIYLSGLAAYGFILIFFPLWATNSIGLLLLLMVALGAALTIVVDIRRGVSIWSTLLYLLVSGALVFAFTYGFMWYFTSQMSFSGSFFGPLRTPTPIPTPTPVPGPY